MPQIFHLSLFFSFYNLDLLLFDTQINVGYLAVHFIVRSLDNITVYYGSYIMIDSR